jgi:DNA-binding IclR family transcriptional regulator
MPMFRGASSKIIFAHLSSRSARWFVLKHPEEVAASGLGADWEAIKVNLRRMRAAGVCITRSEVDRDRVGIAAPVFDPSDTRRKSARARRYATSSTIFPRSAATASRFWRAMCRCF